MIPRAGGAAIPAGGLNAARWQELSPLLDRALEAGAAEQATLVCELAARDELLAADLQSLLDEHRRLAEEGFLDGSASPPPTLAGQAFGPYTLRSEIGLGGMGSVWLADRTDGRYRGQVAVKLLNASRLGGPGEARFRREGSILARLRHPHIAHLMDAGVAAGGQPYLVLEYVRGQRIDEYCAARQLGVEARLRLFLDVLGAVSFAHSQLIVHRDIKPSNVLVGDDGTVKLLDFGIAKLLEEDAAGDEGAALTRDGDIMLTPEFAAPEQLTGEPVTTGTDVYTLGVLLYVLLSGRHPVRITSRSPAELMRAIVDEEPARLATRRLRGDLENIVAKALKKVPAERYPSVAALADDLRRHLEHKPVSARPDALGYRALKFIRRHRSAVLLSALAAAALAAGLLGTVSQARRATRQGALAEAQRERADAAARAAGTERDFALRQLARAQAANDLNVYLMSDAAAAGRPRTADDMLAEAERVVERTQEPSVDIRAQLLMQIGEQYEDRDAIDSGMRVLAKAYALARQAKDPATRARAACALADVVRINDDTAYASRLLDEGLRGLPAGTPNGVDRIFCLIAGSRLAMQLDHDTEALAMAEEAHRLAPTVAVPSAMVEVDTALQLAACYRARSRLRESAALLEEAFARLTSLGRETTERAGTLLNNWALVVSDQGHPRDAVRLYQKAIAIGGGAQSPTLLFNLAAELKDLGRLAEAEPIALRSQEEALRLGERLAVSRVLLLRATIYRRLNRLDRATEMLDRLEAALKAGAVPTQLSFAFLDVVRGEVALARGDRRAAAAGVERGVEAVRRNREAGHSWPAALLRRAEIRLALGRAEGARADAHEALRLWRSQTEQGTLSCWIGRAALVESRALLAQGRQDEARALGAEGLRHLKETLGEAHPETLAARRLAGTVAAS